MATGASTVPGGGPSFSCSKKESVATPGAATPGANIGKSRNADHDASRRGSFSAGLVDRVRPAKPRRGAGLGSGGGGAAAEPAAVGAHELVRAEPGAGFFQG